MIKPTNFHIKDNNLIKFVTKMTKTGAYTPVILLETTVVAGRTYQAYKRGGTTEARERVLEESTGSLVWLGGAVFLFKMGNKIAEKFCGIKNTNFDIGKDSLRNPLEYIAKKTGISKGKLAKFKLANSLISVFAAAGFLGFVVPKLNQKLTKFLYKNKKQNTQQTQQENQTKTTTAPETQIAVAKTVLPQEKQIKTIENFLSNSKTQAEKQDKNVTFKGLLSPTQIATIAYNLENHAVYKLATTDSVVITGRGVNARNKDERREILFRDLASTFFYLFAANQIIDGLKSLDNRIIKGNTGIDPYSAKTIHNFLLDSMPKEKMTVDEFSKFAIGTLDENAINKFTLDNNGIITLDKFKEVIKDKKLQEKALEMSKLQPQKNGVSILTKQQVQNVLNDGKMSDPTMLKKVLNDIFNKKIGSNKDVLGDPSKYISRKNIEASTTTIQDYVKSIIEYAKKHNLKEITPETLYKVNKRNLHHRLGFVAAGFITAAAFLSTIIPKVQYYITKVKTGSDKFPGAKDLENAA